MESRMGLFTDEQAETLEELEDGYGASPNVIFQDDKLGHVVAMFGMTAVYIPAIRGARHRVMRIVE